MGYCVSLTTTVRAILSPILCCLFVARIRMMSMTPITPDTRGMKPSRPKLRTKALDLFIGLKFSLRTLMCMARFPKVAFFEPPSRRVK